MRWIAKVDEIVTFDMVKKTASDNIILPATRLEMDINTTNDEDLVVEKINIVELFGNLVNNAIEISNEGDID